MSRLIEGIGKDGTLIFFDPEAIEVVRMLPDKESADLFRAMITFRSGEQLTLHIRRGAITEWLEGINKRRIGL